MVVVDTVEEAAPETEEKWDFASDKTFRKRLVRKGKGLFCPRDGSVCQFLISALPSTSAETLTSRSLQIGNSIDETKKIVIGEHDTELDHMLDKVLEHMKAEEIAEFKFNINAVEHTSLKTEAPKARELAQIAVRLELLNFVEVPELWELNSAQLIDGGRHHKEEGVKWFKKGNLVYALRRFMKAIRFLIVVDKEILENLAKESKEAAELLQEYRVLMANVYVNISAVQLRSNNHHSVVDNCGRALALDPSNVKAFYRRGVAHSSLGNSSSAKADFLSALKLSPNDKDIRNELGKYGIANKQSS